MTGKYDARNKLNNLTGKEWLKLTKSYWFSESCKDDKFAFKHPAPFLIKDIEKLIAFFTKKNQVVLDPFAGVATTLVACNNLKRVGFGIELNEEYVGLAEARLRELGITKGQTVLTGDSLDVIPNLNQKFDYCVTSPPYHNILQNNGQGLRAQKNGYRNGARNGVDYYSNKEADLGNQESYEEFLNLLGDIMGQVKLKLKRGKYCSIVISDFTVNKKEHHVQGDVVRMMEDVGFQFSGSVALLQENKPLYPFGYPYAYVINHHHQSILNFRKPK